MMKLDRYRVANNICKGYATQPLTFDAIYGGANTRDSSRVGVWHGNNPARPATNPLPVLMTDGHVILWRPPSGMFLPWGFPMDGHQGTEYSTEGAASMKSMCEQ